MIPVPPSQNSAVIERGVAVMRAEAQAILAAANRLDSRFAQAVLLIAGVRGNVIVSGIGKSGHVARKIAATFSSTGTAAFFLHAAEAQHGDIGSCRSGDAAILLSKSGCTAELRALVPALHERGIPVIAIAGAADSPLAEAADIVLDAGVAAEADPHNLAPSCSTSVALAIGDSLAFAVAEVRGHCAETLARNHPGGSTGALFRLSVHQLMTPHNRLPHVQPEDPLRFIVDQVTAGGIGCVCVQGPNGDLQGLVTDGDIRRAIQKFGEATPRAIDIMTSRPVTIQASETLYRALQLMENRPSEISVLPVVDGVRYVGIIRLHDIYRSGLL
jgi:arabinose-5-phosphate isomerase